MYINTLLHIYAKRRKLSRSDVTFDKKKEWHLDDIARQDLQNKQNKKYTFEL
jgi:hypothetical protein